MKCLIGICAKTLYFVAALLVLGCFLTIGEKSWAANPVKKQAKRPAPVRKLASTSTSEAELKAHIARNDKDIPARIQLAELLKKKKDYEGMLGALRPASDNLPRKGMLLLAEAYQGKKDLLNQVRVLELLLAQNPKDYYVQNIVGEAYISVNRYDEAAAKFQEARKLNHQFLPAYRNLLAQHESSGEKYEARNILNDMIRVFGEKAEFYNDLCRLYSIDGYLEKSAEVCKKAISKQHRHAPNHMYYAQTLWNQEKKESAIKVLKQAAKNFPKAEEVQFATGEMTFNTGDFINSFKYFDQCVKFHAKSSKCHLGYSKSAFELQKYAEALNGFSTLCKLDNSSFGEFRKALSALRQKNEFVWANKFDSGLNRCEAITN